MKRMGRFCELAGSPVQADLHNGLTSETNAFPPPKFDHEASSPGGSETTGVGMHVPGVREQFQAGQDTVPETPELYGREPRGEGGPDD